MKTRTLYLAWQSDQADSEHLDGRTWFPVGRLDADVEESTYRFRYTKGAKEAKLKAGFFPLPEFPDFEGDYESLALFPVFQNRVISRNRPDFAEYVRVLALDEDADQIEILSANGGKRATDSFAVFPEPDTGADGNFSCRFFLPGGVHVEQPAGSRVDELRPGDKLKVSLAGKLSSGSPRLRLKTEEGQEVGWVPQYLTHGNVSCGDPLGEYEATVVRVNPPPDPSSQRALIELSGNMGDHEPMSGPDFQPLVPDQPPAVGRCQLPDYPRFFPRSA